MKGDGRKELEDWMIRRGRGLEGRDWNEDRAKGK